MGAVSALRTTGGALARNPVVFVGAFLVALLSILTQVPQFAAQTLSSPVVSLLVSLLVPILAFFLTPFLVAGLLGMATEAVVGETSLWTFIQVGKARYVTLLLATLLYTVLSIVFAIGFLIVGFIVVVAVGVGFGGGDPGIAALAVIALVVLALVVAFLLFMFFLQFYGVAIVVEEAGIVDSFKRSYRVVRRNLLSTLGYNVIAFLVLLLVAIPAFAVVAGTLVVTGGVPSAPTPPTPAGAPAEGFDLPLATIAVGVLGLFVVQTLTSAINRTYSVAFYRDRRGLDGIRADSQEPSQQPGD